MEYGLIEDVKWGRKKMKMLYSKTIDKNWKKYNELYDKAQKKGYGLWDRMTKSQFEEAMMDVKFSDSFSKQKTSYADYIFKEYSRTIILINITSIKLVWDVQVTSKMDIYILLVIWGGKI